MIRGIANSTVAPGHAWGGLGAKVVGACDATGRLVDFLPMPGQGRRQLDCRPACELQSGPVGERDGTCLPELSPLPLPG